MSVGPVLNPSKFLECGDPFGYALEFCDPETIGNLTCVSKLAKENIDKSKIWKTYFEREGLPRVVDDQGYRDNFKHFKCMRAMTCVSGSKIAAVLGRVIDPIPPIHVKFVELLDKADPFELKKLMKNNYRFVVVPNWLERADALLALDESGNLRKLSNEEHASLPTADQPTVLRIPLHLKNLRVLSSLPLKGKNRPVFSGESWEEIFTQCEGLSDKVRVYLMRNHLVEKSRGKSYETQEALVKQHGFAVIPLRVRALFDVMSILIEGKCPDGREPWSYVRCSDIVQFDNSIDDAYHATIGGFAPDVGVHVHAVNFGGERVGVVPGCPADETSFVTKSVEVGCQLAERSLL